MAFRGLPALEDTGVAAYKGQAALIKSDAVLQAALAIHAVEARHAAWIRYVNGTPPAPGRVRRTREHEGRAQGGRQDEVHRRLRVQARTVAPFA